MLLQIIRGQLYLSNQINGWYYEQELNNILIIFYVNTHTVPTFLEIASQNDAGFISTYKYCLQHRRN